MMKENMKGVLFFSDQHPQISGYLVIGGVEFEIAGWHATKIRSEISARKRGPEQTDFFGGSRTGDPDGERCTDDARDRAAGQQGKPEPTE